MLKSDNGSAFIAEALQDLLAAKSIENLRSPSWTPEYNGSCEAGNGAMAARTRCLAARRGTGEWSADDCETARSLANAFVRPRGLHGLTPDEAWAARSPITPDERARFRMLVAQCERETRLDRGLPLDLHLTGSDQAAITRAAIRRALVALGLLSIRRGPIPLPVSSPLPARIP